MVPLHSLSDRQTRPTVDDEAQSLGYSFLHEAMTTVGGRPVINTEVEKCYKNTWSNIEDAKNSVLMNEMASGKFGKLFAKGLRIHTSPMMALTKTIAQELMEESLTTGKLINAFVAAKDAYSHLVSEKT
ncbi:hypothetical protein DL93DRAFT_2074239 [Clavulina sp. PMI_390]|nr:hypothetical protein DL93DRAFT_2074239 [Clavulina sp. PMI_390]